MTADDTGPAAGRGDDAEPDTRPPRRLADALDRVLNGLGGRPGTTGPTGGAAGLFSRWAELVGPEIARHARPVGVQDGELLVVVDDAAWASQLRWLGPDLLARISSAGGPRLAGLQVRVKPR